MIEFRDDISCKSYRDCRDFELGMHQISEKYPVLSGIFLPFNWIVGCHPPGI